MENKLSFKYDVESHIIIHTVFYPSHSELAISSKPCDVKKV